MSLASLFRRNRHRDVALMLYEAVVERAREPWFFTRLGVPDTFDGRFELTALHGFLVLNRLKADRPRAAELAQELFDAMFADFDRSLREMGLGDLGVGRQVKTMAKAFYGRIGAYEAGLKAGEAAALGGMTQWPPEFWRPVSIARLAADATIYRLTATAEERDALARRFALVSLDGFAATVELSRHGREIRLAAEIIADVVQLCGVTLEPFASRVTDRSSLLYRRQTRPDELAVELDAEEAECEGRYSEKIYSGRALAQRLM